MTLAARFGFPLAFGLGAPLFYNIGGSVAAIAFLVGGGVATACGIAIMLAPER